MNESLKTLATFPISFALGGAAGVSLLNLYRSLDSALATATETTVINIAGLALVLSLLLLVANWPVVSISRLWALASGHTEKSGQAESFVNAGVPRWVFPVRGYITARWWLALAACGATWAYSSNQPLNDEDIFAATAILAVGLLVGAFFIWRGRREASLYQAAATGDCLAVWKMDDSESKLCRTCFYRDLLGRITRFIGIPLGLALTAAIGVTLYYWYDGVEAWWDQGFRLIGTALVVGGLALTGWCVLLIPNFLIVSRRNIHALFLEDRFCFAGHSVAIRSDQDRRKVTADKLSEHTLLTITLVWESRHHSWNNPHGRMRIITNTTTSRVYRIPVPKDHSHAIARIRANYQR